jgi:hypothetical protein
MLFESPADEVMSLYHQHRSDEDKSVLAWRSRVLCQLLLFPKEGTPNYERLGRKRYLNTVFSSHQFESTYICFTQASMYQLFHTTGNINSMGEEEEEEDYGALIYRESQLRKAEAAAAE